MEGNTYKVNERGINRNKKWKTHKQKKGGRKRKKGMDRWLGEWKEGERGIKEWKDG